MPNNPSRRKAPVIPDNVTSDTMLRLEVAVVLGFPDGSMPVAGLRREAQAGHLAIYRIAGKDYTTLANIEGLKAACRVPAKARGSTSRRRKTGDGSGSSGTASRTSAQAALKATAQALKENLPPTSPASTTLAQVGVAVIPMRLK